MIAFVRTACIAPGKNAAAMTFARAIAAHLKTTQGIELEVLRPIGGNPSRIAWSARYKDLATFETVTAKLAGDNAYWELVGKNSDCFLAGSFNDAIWTTS
jgi:hypothetical protein